MARCARHYSSRMLVVPVITVFVHGAGRDGPAAWPLQQRQEALGERFWLDWPEERTDSNRPATPDLVERQVEAMLGVLEAPGNVVAHSHGAVAALLAAERSPASVRRLVLFEPACFGLARGGAHVEDHIATMAPVLALATDPAIGDEEYATRFFSALRAPAPATPTEAQRLALRRLRRAPTPWEIDLNPTVVTRTGPLVVTGGWHPLYEEVAAALVRLGARHEVLTGHGHRPQDHPRANDLLREFLTKP
jgi:pimeloyl-ACP methyl ester carboxylesterase